MAYYYQGNSKPYYGGDGQDARIQIQQDAGSGKPKWNWCAHGWAFFATFFCSWCAGISSLFGFGGLLCAISAYTDHKAGEYERSRYKKMCAIGWTVAGMLLGAAALSCMIYFAYQYWQLLGPALMDRFNGATSGTT